MKKKAISSQFMKQITAALLASMTKAKACTSTIKLLFSVLRNKKLFMITTSISGKLLPQQRREGETSKDIVLYQGDQAGGPLHRFRNWWPGKSHSAEHDKEEEEEEEEYDLDEFPDLMHSMFNDEGFAELDDEEEGVINGGSVVEVVKSSREGSGEEFRLEDGIDRVADLFIRRFHLQQRMQRQLSLKSNRLITNT